MPSIAAVIAAAPVNGAPQFRRHNHGRHSTGQLALGASRADYTAVKTTLHNHSMTDHPVRPGSSAALPHPPPPISAPIEAQGSSSENKSEPAGFSRPGCKNKRTFRFISARRQASDRLLSSVLTTVSGTVLGESELTRRPPGFVPAHVLILLPFFAAPDANRRSGYAVRSAGIAFQYPHTSLD